MKDANPLEHSRHPFPVLLPQTKPLPFLCQ